MKQAILITALATILVSFIDGSPGNPITKFKWLEGKWAAKVKRGTIVEEWTVASDTSLQGQCKFVNETGKERVYEKLLFLYAGGQFSYNITLLEQPDKKEVPFIITSYTEKGFVAENAGHDFPKRIVYTLISTDSVHAFIDGGISEPGKRSDFYYIKVKH